MPIGRKSNIKMPNACSASSLKPETLMSTTEAASARVAGASQGIALIALAMLPTLAIVSLVPNLPQLFQHFSNVPGHELYVPMILTMPSLCIAIFAPLVAGPLADLWGRRRLMLVGLAAYTVLGLLPLFLDDLFAIIASRAVVG